MEHKQSYIENSNFVIEYNNPDVRIEVEIPTGALVGVEINYAEGITLQQLKSYTTKAYSKYNKFLKSKNFEELFN